MTTPRNGNTTATVFLTTITCLLNLGLLIGIAPRATAQSLKNLFTNLDFSRGNGAPTAWTLAPKTPSTYQLARDTQMRHDGSDSLRITNTGKPEQGIIAQVGTFVPGKPFVFSGYVRAQG